MATFRVLVVGDLHAGSTVAPWPEGMPLPDGGEWQPGVIQRWLGDCWDSLLEHALSFDHIDALIHNGDAIDGGHPNNAGVVTNRLDYQADAAIELLAPLRECADKFYMVQGTSWHVGRGAENETAIARELDAVPHRDSGALVWPELWLDLGGVIGHWAHHVGTTANPFGEATAPWRDLQMLRLAALNAGYPWANEVRLMVRNHRHRMIHVEKDGMHALTVTGWQLKTEFGYKVAPNSVSEIGYAVIECEGGNVRVDMRTFRGYLPRVEGR